MARRADPERIHDARREANPARLMANRASCRTAPGPSSLAGKPSPTLRAAERDLWHPVAALVAIIATPLTVRSLWGRCPGGDGRPEVLSGAHGKGTLGAFTHRAVAAGGHGMQGGQRCRST